MLKNCKIEKITDISGYYAPQVDADGELVSRTDDRFIMSQSSLSRFTENPEAWILGDQDVEDQSKSIEWGHLLDCLLTNPEKFNENYSILPSTYPSKDGDKKWNMNSDYCKKWVADKQGTELISPKLYQEALTAANILRGNDTARNFIESSLFQSKITAEWHDDNGMIIPLRGLVDGIYSKDTGERFLWDLKTCRDANPSRWDSHCRQYGYFLQAALYLDICRQAEPNLNPDWFSWIIQKNTWPYSVSTIRAHEIQLADGRHQYQSALKLRSDCLKNFTWPGYTSGWTTCEVPAWRNKI